MNGKGILFTLLTTIGLMLNAQESVVDTIMHLDTVSISSERYMIFTAGQKTITIPARVMQEDQRNNIGNILRENTAVYIRSYGQNTLTSMSVRGTSANQSSIFWNGINIRMPSLGSTDLSMIKSSFFSSASIVLGGNGTKYGSGTIGGAIFLRNEADFSRSLEAGISLNAGSFASWGTGLNIKVASEKLYFRLAFNSFNSENNYTYLDIKGEEKELDNASVGELGLTAHTALKIGIKNQLDLYFWYQEAQREIPPTLTTAKSDAYQSDRAYRSSLQWKSVFSKGVLHLKTAWFSEYENYTDPMMRLKSIINTTTWFAEAEYSHEIYRNGSLDAGMSYTAEQADIDAYLEEETRNIGAVFLNFKHHFHKIEWDLVAGLRQEISEGEPVPITPAIGLEGKIFSLLRHKISISRNYRLPTMNEMYWKPGGNPDVKPEKSWNAELSLILDVIRQENHRLSFTGTIYNSYVDDWIQWVPGSNYWSVENVQEVWSRGAEIQLDHGITVRETIAGATLNYTFSRSTNEADGLSESTKGKQLIYTPLHNASAKMYIEIYRWRLDLVGNYTGMTFTSTDNNEELPGFFLADLAIGKTIETSKFGIIIMARVNNIFNKEYEVVAYRPMPGINFNINASLNFKTKKK